MGKGDSYDWDPRSAQVLDDQIGSYDEMRQRCPVARSRYGYVSLFKHADVRRVLLDPDTFSSAVSRFPSVPNGMDAPQHTAFRSLIDPYFEPDRMQVFEPVCARIAHALVDALPVDGSVEFMGGFAWEFAVQVQCAFMGWPDSLQAPLRKWTLRNHAATLAIDPDAMEAVAREFDGYVRALVVQRRLAGKQAPDDVTTRLVHEQLDGRPLDDAEIVSIARNWTVGELSTIAASVGIIAEYLAAHPALQQQLRTTPALMTAAADEILRMHGPLIMNRRRVTADVTIRGRSLRAGDRLALIWPSANRDEEVFGNPDEFRLDRDPALNLLYGAGPHVCPGAPLARLELRVMLEALLGGTTRIERIEGQKATNARYPASGYARLPLHISKS